MLDLEQNSEREEVFYRIKYLVEDREGGHQMGVMTCTREALGKLVEIISIDRTIISIRIQD